MICIYAFRHVAFTSCVTSSVRKNGTFNVEHIGFQPLAFVCRISSHLFHKNARIDHLVLIARNKNEIIKIGYTFSTLTTFKNKPVGDMDLREFIAVLRLDLYYKYRDYSYLEK